MNAAERAPYLEAGDVALIPLGFKRKKKEFMWRRAVDSDIEWIHLNFGKGMIGPSYGVHYADLERLFPPDLGVRGGPWCLLEHLTGTSYSSSTTPPDVVARDLLIAVEELRALSDRQGYTDVLMSEQRPRKFVVLTVDRIRMLPVLLASFGRFKEAFTWLARFELLAKESDQMVPPYEAFAAHFRATYESKKEA